MDWNEQLPTDSEIIWCIFCTYMDFILAPCSTLTSAEPLKPFSSAFTQKGDTPSSSNESYFIRMVILI